MRDLLQLSDNKILLLLFITAMFICVCSNILLVHSILEGEKKNEKDMQHIWFFSSAISIWIYYMYD